MRKPIQSSEIRSIPAAPYVKHKLSCGLDPETCTRTTRLPAGAAGLRGWTPACSEPQPGSGFMPGNAMGVGYSTVGDQGVSIVQDLRFGPRACANVRDGDNSSKWMSILKPQGRDRQQSRRQKVNAKLRRRTLDPSLIASLFYVGALFQRSQEEIERACH